MLRREVVPRTDNDALGQVLARARRQVLRATVVICVLIVLGNLAGAVVQFTRSGGAGGPAIIFAAAWSALWAAAAARPEVTARCFTRWRPTALALVCANTATVAVTGGIDSPDLAVCMYVGWIASVVVTPRAAIAMSLAITASIVGGYLLAGASVTEIVGGEDRYNTVTSAVLPIITGGVGVLLASVTNAVFSQLPQTVHELRQGWVATTPGLTALFAGRPLPMLPVPRAQDSGGEMIVARLTPAEREVVALLADGHRPKQIALLRGVALATVRSQIKTAKRKAAARTIGELVAVAWEPSA